MIFVYILIVYLIIAGILATYCFGRVSIMTEDEIISSLRNGARLCDCDPDDALGEMVDDEGHFVWKVYLKNTLFGCLAWPLPVVDMIKRIIEVGR